MTGIRAVLFDWRGTLVVTPPERDWVTEALRRLERAGELPDEILQRIESAPGVDRLWAPKVDCCPKAPPGGSSC